MKSDKSRTPEHYFDVRVRDRLVASGVLDAKVLEKHIAELPDLEAQADSIFIDQPALNPRESE
jgi:hypothetical protein